MCSTFFNVLYRSALIFLLTILFLLCFFKDSVAQSGDTKELIDAIKSAPSLYRTPGAVEYFSRLGQAGFSVAQDRDAALSGLRAAIKLGDMGQAARDAVGTLADVFPRLEHVVSKRSVHYIPGNGTLEDWVQTFLVSEKNNFIFSSPFIEYASLSKCENWIEASPVTTILSKKIGSGGKILDAVADIFIILRVNAGACALARITGNDLGVNPEPWRNLYIQTGSVPPRDVSMAPADRPPAGVRQIPFPDIVVGGRYKLHLVTNDDLVGTISSRDDSSLVLKNDEGVPYSFYTMLIEKFERINAPGQEAGAAVKKDASTNDRPEMGALGFDDLLQGNLTGKMLEIRIKNGSIFKGTLTQVTSELARINVEGSEISVSRGVIINIRLLPK